VLPSGTGVVNLGLVNKITFPGTQVPSAGANDFDDYEEGVFTPNVLFGGLNVGMTYTIQQAMYTKKGREVGLSIWLALSAKGSSVGIMTISGLPFTQANTIGALAIRATNMAAGLGTSFVMAMINQASTTIKLDKLVAGVATQLTDADFTATSVLQISGVYQT
jgi:hypothetical protein